MNYPPMDPQMHPGIDPHMLAFQNEEPTSSCQILRKYYGCISLRAGGVISCLVWAGFSLYFAALAFQLKSPFYSYLGNSAALYAFGVINIFMVLFSFMCLFVLVFLRDQHDPIKMQQYANYVRSMSHSSAVLSFVLVLDYLVNMCIFINGASAYSDWCLNSSSQALIQGANVSSNGLHNSDQGSIVDYYNCNRLWQDEIKFSVVVLLLMIGYYAYTSACLMSYSHKLVALITRRQLEEMMGQHGPPLTPMTPQGPPQGQPQAAQFQQQAPIIVLNNSRPSSKSRTSGFSLPRFLRKTPSDITDISNGSNGDIEKGNIGIKRKPI